MRRVFSTAGKEERAAAGASGIPCLTSPGGRGVVDILFIDNLLVRIHLIIVMIRWTGLALWESEFPGPGSLKCIFPGGGGTFLG